MNLLKSCYFEFFRVGIDLPTIEVRFEHLNVEAEAFVGGRALPTFFNFSVNIVEVTSSKICTSQLHNFAFEVFLLSCY